MCGWVGFVCLYSTEEKTCAYVNPQCGLRWGAAYDGEGTYVKQLINANKWVGNVADG